MHLAQEKRPRLILLDLLMPEMDGFAVLRAVRDERALEHTAVVAITATSYAEQALRRQGSHFTLSQSMGLSSGPLVDLLAATLDIVQPGYASVGSKISRA